MTDVAQAVVTDVAQKWVAAVPGGRGLALAGACLALLVGCNTPEEPRDRATTESPTSEEVAPPGERARGTPEAPTRDTAEDQEAPAPQPEVEPRGELARDTPEDQEEAPALEQAPPCEIRIVSMLDANVYRGVPRTPALEASRQRRSPEQLARDRARDHGVRHLSCDYVVELDGRRYRHTYHSGASPFERPDASECETDETKATAVERLRRSTHDCTDLDRGAYYGVTLEPMP